MTSMQGVRHQRPLQDSLRWSDDDEHRHRDCAECTVVLTRSRLPLMRWRPFTRAGLQADVVAGALLGLVAVPQSLAYATLAGMPPHHGLWAAILPCAVGAILGWSNHLHTGPVAMSALFTAVVLAPLAVPGSPTWVAAALMLALLVGIIRIAAGLLRASVIADLVSHPVLAGFTAGAAVVIICSQVHPLLGVPHDGNGLMLAAVVRQCADVNQFHGATVLMGITCATGMLALRAWAPRWPGMLIVLASATMLAWTTGYTGRTVGPVPIGLPPLTWPTWDTGLVLTLLPGAGWVALIGFLEVLSVVKSCAARTGQDNDLDREMLAQGAASIAAASTGGFPVSGSLSRSSPASARRPRSIPAPRRSRPAPGSADNGG
jgi:SulP family sulfate permease